MPRSLTVAFACLALGGAFVAGCGDDDEETADTPPAAQQEREPAADPGATGATTVSMRNNENIPGEVEVAVGETITWTNDDDYPHTVTATEGAEFDSGNVEGGGTYEYTAQEPGTIQYVCEIHPGQDGTITVTE